MQDAGRVDIYPRFRIVRLPYYIPRLADDLLFSVSPIFSLFLSISLLITLPPSMRSLQRHDSFASSFRMGLSLADRCECMHHLEREQYPAMMRLFADPFWPSAKYTLFIHFEPTRNIVEDPMTFAKFHMSDTKLV